jgi:hypothetical protein
MQWTQYYTWISHYIITFNTAIYVINLQNLFVHTSLLVNTKDSHEWLPCLQQTMQCNLLSHNFMPDQINFPFNEWKM